VGLTVNGTSGTAATALSVAQTGAATAMSVTTSNTGTGLALTSSSTGTGQTITLTNTSGTQAAGLSITRNGGGGTTTDLLNLTNTAGTVTTALKIVGTFTNVLDSPTVDISNAGVISGATGLTSSGTITFSGLASAGIVTNTAGGVLGTTSTVPVANGGTGIASYTIGDLIYASGATTLSKLADVALGSCLISQGVGVAPTWGACGSTNIVQVPGSTAQNTITPTAASVVGLTVNGTSSTAATALNVLQAGAATALSVTTSNTGTGLAITSSSSGTGQAISLTNTTGTQAAGLSITRNGGGGTTTDLLNLTNTAGTVTTALKVVGTYTNLLDTPTVDISNAGILSGATGISSSGTITFSGLSSAGIVTNTAGGVLGTVTTVPVANGGTGLASYTIGDLLYASGATTLSKLAAVAGGSCLISQGVGVAPIWGACGTGNLVQVPTSTAQNTITPTTASVVALTVNGTSSTAATALNVIQAGAATALNVTTSNTGTGLAITSSSTGSGETITLTNTTGTQAAGFSITRNGSGGTTTDLLNLTNTLGTVTTALKIVGTFTNILDSPTVDISNAGVISGATGLTSSGTITFSGLSSAGIVTNTAGGVLGTTTTVPVANGGTGLASYTIGDLLYASGATTIAKLADVAAGSCLNSGGVGVAPTWGTCGAGISIVGTYSTTNTAAGGATIVGNTITFQDASATAPGMVGTGTQTFAGAKTFNGSVTLAATQTITLIGNVTGSRPGSPTAGMLYYDTTTNQLVQWNGTKWVSAPRISTRIIAPSNASQTAKDSADVVLTGTADQTLINTALTAAAGGTVYILEGTVTVTGSISVPNNTTLSGAGSGTLITIPNTFNANINMITNTTTGGAGTGVTIRDMQLDGNMANQTAGNMFGIYMNGMGAIGATALTGVPGAKINNLWVKDFKGTTFTNSSSLGGAINLTNSFNTSVSNSVLTATVNKSSTSVYLSASSNNTFTGNNIHGTYTGIYLFDSSNNNFNGNTVARSPDYGVNIEGASTANTFVGNTFIDGAETIVIWGANSANNVITGNTFEDTNNFISRFIEVQSANNTITGNSFLFDPAVPQEGVTLSASTSKYNTVSGNTFSGAFNAIAIWSNASYNNVSNNNIIMTNTGTTASSEAIILNSTHHNTITNNTITNPGGAADNNGIYLTSNADSNIITGNSITDSSASTTNYAINIFASTCDSNYLSNNLLGTGSINDVGTGTIYGGQVDNSNNFLIQPTGNVELLKSGVTSGNLKVGTVDIMPTITTSVKSTSSGTFAAKVDYTTATAPQDVTAADFNGDGKVDMAVSNTSSTSVSVFINNGNGTFATKVDYTTGSSPQGITSADFNNDGYPDIAVANNASTTISIFINSGTGTFAAKVDYATNANPIGITTADFNSDGYPDLAVGNNGAGAGTTTSVFINNGNGTFATKADYTTGTSPQGITSADFNGDGKPDLAVVNNTSLTISILMNTGTGTFAAKVDYATGTSPKDITAGDFNGDGKLDLAIASFSSVISVYINNGSGIFAAKVDYAAGTSPRGITADDFNGDGTLDIAAANSSNTSMSVFINNGNGTFATKADYTTGTTPFGVVSADFNNDDFPDLAFANNGSTSVSVFMNIVSGGFNSSTTTQFSPKAAVISDSGKVGLLVQGASSSDNIFQAQDSTGKLLASIDGVGRLTVSGGSVYQAQLAQDQQLAFATKVDYTSGTSPNSIDAADVSGDGKPDFVTTNSGSALASVFINSGLGSGQFGASPPTATTKVDYTTGNGPGGANLADVNNDGKMDMLVSNYNSTTVSVFINNSNGAGQFGASPPTANPVKVDYATGTNPFTKKTTDINGDGYADIIVSNFNGGGAGTVSVLRNNGNGTFAAKVDYSIGTAARGLAISDVNNDGKPDVVVTNESANTMSVLLNIGSGAFAGSVTTYATGTTPYAVDMADVNNDGFPDALIANHGTTTASVLLNDGDGTFATKVDYTVGSAPNTVNAADMNNDGKPDMIVGNGTSNTVSVLLNDGTGAFVSKSDFAVATGPAGVAVADVNGDGKRDIMAVGYGAGGVSILINASTAKADPTTKGTLSVTTADRGSGGLYIQGSLDQAADYLVIQDSTGTDLLSVDSAGTLTASQLIVTGDAILGKTSVSLAGTATVNGVCQSGSDIDAATGVTRQLVACSAAPNDYAEMYPTETNVEAGDIVATTPNLLTYEASGADAETGIVHSMGTKQISILKKAVVGDSAIGIVSTAPYQTIGKDVPISSHRMPIALNGRVPVKVNNEGGTIAAGDQLALSSVPGYATKATVAGKTIAIALEPFDGTSGSIMAYVQTGYYTPPMDDVLQGSDLSITGNATIAGNLSVGGNINVLGAITTSSLTVTDSVAVQGNLVVEGDIEVRNITINGHIVTAGNAPAISLGVAAGQVAVNQNQLVATVDGNDSAGTVSVTTGSQNLANGVLAHISFAEAFNGSYKVVLSASNDPAGLLRVHTVKTATGFDIVANDIVTAQTQYTFDYIVLGATTTP
jgi:parallel beta-helix repeat protein